MRYRLFCCFGVIALACASTGGAQREEKTAHSHAGHSHQEQPPSTAAHAPAAEAPPSQDPAELEVAAYDAARPILEEYCAKCHTTQGSKSSSKALTHFNMDNYPFGGHHADEITAAIRKTLGAAGSTPTMPRDKPGAVKGDKLRTILAWADAYDRAHANASPEKSHDDQHRSSGHEHHEH